jgi:myo-inositol-1(or 4)-monophosphatase
MSPYTSERKALIRAAELAGKSLMRDFARLAMLPFSEKGPSDFVSSADLDAQSVLTTELGAAFPAYGFLVEEAPAARASSTEASRAADTPERPDARFIVDPLDGTTNFLHGIPHFAVSVALEIDGEVTVGVVLNPATSELFWAEKSGGSWLGDRRITVATPRKTAHSVVGTGIPHLGRPAHERFLGSLAKIMPEVAGIRRLGCAALDLAYVAAGRFDMFWEVGLSPWDIAAGQLLVKEAGGVVTDCSGGPLRLDGPDILAANGEALHRAAIQWLAPSDRDA